MAHSRTRILEEAFRKACTWSPVIALLGMRQTGKTTLLRELAKSYYNFDDVSVISRFETERTALLEQGPYPLGLDEVQKFPPLFDALKAAVDRKKVPGRYLLTGSVRFSSRKEIRESMTGRISSLELFPLCMTECHGKKAVSFLEPFKKHGMDPHRVLAQLEKRAWAKESAIDHYLETGGLPGICLRREKSVRGQLFEGHLDTLLGRDIALVADLRLSISQLKTLFRWICLEQGAAVSHSRLARELGVSAPTIKKALVAMEGLFLIRRHGRTYYSEDLGLSSHACRMDPRSARRDLRRFVYRELKTNLDYLNPLEAELGEYWTPGGIDIPIVMQTQHGFRIAVTVDDLDLPSEKSLKSLTYFRKKYPAASLLAVHLGAKAYVSSTGVLCVPRAWIP